MYGGIGYLHFKGLLNYVRVWLFGREKVIFVQTVADTTDNLKKIEVYSGKIVQLGVDV